MDCGRTSLLLLRLRIKGESDAIQILCFGTEYYYVVCIVEKAGSFWVDAGKVGQSGCFLFLLLSQYVLRSTSA